MGYSIVKKTALMQTWEVQDEAGEAKWVYDTWEKAIDRAELEQDRLTIAEAYPSNLRLTEYPTGIHIKGDERHTFVVKAVEFDEFAEFTELVCENPEDVFFLRDAKVVNGKNGRVVFSIRFGTLSGNYYRD